MVFLTRTTGMSPIDDVICARQMHYHQYADDLTLYTVILPSCSESFHQLQIALMPHAHGLWRMFRC